MRKVKMFEDKYLPPVETYVNNWLEENPDITIIEFLQGCSKAANQYTTYSTYWFTIIYMEN